MRVIACPRNAAPIPPVRVVSQPPPIPMKTARPNTWRLRPGAPVRVTSTYRIAWMTIAGRESTPARRRKPRTRPRKVASSMNAVPIAFTTAPGYDRSGGIRSRPYRIQANETTTPAPIAPSPNPPNSAPPRSPSPSSSSFDGAGWTRSTATTSPNPSTYHAVRVRSGLGLSLNAGSSYSAAPNEAASRRSRHSSPVRPSATRSRSSASTEGAAPSRNRPCAGRRGRPLAGSRPTRRASCAACLPSASRAASASA